MPPFRHPKHEPLQPPRQAAQYDNRLGRLLSTRAQACQVAAPIGEPAVQTEHGKTCAIVGRLARVANDKSA